jgi:hypothetical protein
MANGNAKVISLKARASQVSHLCFPYNGVIENFSQVFVAPTPTFPPPGLTGQTPYILHIQLPGSYRSIQLGDPVTPFPFTNFYGNLSKVSSDPSRLVYDSTGISTDPTVQASALVTLRGELIAAALDKAVNARQNAFWAKYANKDEIISVMNNFYGATAPYPSVTVSKPDALARLFNVAQDQMIDLQAGYQQAPLPTIMGLPNVVPLTTSILNTTGNFPDTSQTVTNRGYTYRTPAYEAEAQGLRAQISLIDQQFSQFMSGQNLSNLRNVFKNELQGGIDLDVKRLQIAYLNTILMSPITGVITGIYKNPGDWVQAGEPVIRVEDNTNVILVGKLAYRGVISIGQQMTVYTTLADSMSVPPIVGNVVAARGHSDQDDVWDVHALWTNSTNPLLPLNYHFDYDNTSVFISS